MATLDGDGAGGEAVVAGPPIANVLSTMMSTRRLVMNTTTLTHTRLGIGGLAVRAVGRFMDNESHGRLTEEDSRGCGGEGNNVRALCRALCRVCLSWDSTHPLNDINDNRAATMTMTGLLLFCGPLYLKKDNFPTLLSLSL